MGTTLAFALGFLGMAGFLPNLAALALLSYCFMPAWPPAACTRKAARWRRPWPGADLAEARAHLAMIVGRETAQLDPEEIQPGGHRNRGGESGGRGGGPHVFHPAAGPAGALPL